MCHHADGRCVTTANESYRVAGRIPRSPRRAARVRVGQRRRWRRSDRTDRRWSAAPATNRDLNRCIGRPPRPFPGLGSSHPVCTLNISESGTPNQHKRRRQGVRAARSRVDLVYGYGTVQSRVCGVVELDAGGVGNLVLGGTGPEAAVPVSDCGYRSAKPRMPRTRASHSYWLAS